MSIHKFFRSILHRERKLQVDILITFIIFFLLTCFSIIGYNYYIQANAELALASQLMAKTEAAVVFDIHEYLRPAAMAKIMAGLLTKNELNVRKNKDNLAFIQDLIKFYPQLVSVRFADEQGNYIQEIVIDSANLVSIANSALPPGTKYITTQIETINQQRQQTWWYKNANDKIIKVVTSKKVNYNPLTRPWYLSAKQNPHTRWVGIYHSTTLNRTTITVSYPIVDAAGNFQGVVDTDLPVENLTAFLTKNQISKSAYVFILDENEKVIALQAQASKKLKKYPTKLLQPINSVAEPRILTAYNYFKETGKKNFVFRYGYSKYIAEFTNFSKGSDKTWVIGLVIPIKQYIGGLRRADEVSLMFSLVILMLGIASILAIAKGISKPIVQLTKNMYQLKQFHLDLTTQTNSHIAEVHMMQEALVTMKTGLKSFARYVPRALVRTLTQTGEVAKNDTQKKELTLLFSGIADFTEIIELLPPEDIASQLYEYLDELTKIIKDQQGTIDKYMGDAIMAMWGAPIEDEDHVINACRATLLCKKKITELNQIWRSQGKPTFPTRFGINTGNALVGNVGSSDRINYTVIGDAVNLAARLESINKLYGTQIIVSDDVYQIAQHHYLFRPLDIVTVKGKTQSTLIYELLAYKKYDKYLSATDDEWQLAKLSTQAFMLYCQDKWDLAYSAYQEILSHYPHDQVAQFFLQRCARHLGITVTH